ncbi:hypothetical protein L598_000500001470 [Mesorhizobium sp. J18]|uniref:hypothetical protein n=1 Tax=Mesorhizobium sp. J18 TaxID=935263 RepID=UPI001198DFB7|nr:hypothetical protein [Mesorhizobium sp. J18]TWG92481.1 hypothetical protein L598_000500001470 [Mesorhizobium sp. J18]
MTAGVTSEAVFPAIADVKWMLIVAAAAFLAVVAPQMPLLAQGLDNTEAIDTIIGSDVKTEEKRVENDPDRVIAAIENTGQTIPAVRKAFNVNEVDIVFLPDLDEKGSEVQTAIEKHGAQIEDLRKAIEGSAMFFHAVDSRQVLLRNVVALEFGENESVTIFVAGKDPSSQ